MDKRIVEIQVNRNQETEDMQRSVAFDNKDPKNIKVTKILMFFSVFFGIAIILIGALFLIIMVCPLKEAEVTNCTLYDDKFIEETILNDKYSVNTVYVFVKNAFLPVKNIPFVDHYRVTMLSPNKIRIDVTEKKLFAYITSDSGEYVYFDDDGTVLEISDRLIEGVLPIMGISCEGASVGGKLPVEESTLMGILTLLKNLKKYEIEAENFYFDERGNLTYNVSRISVVFGSVDKDVADKVLRLSAILPKISDEKGILHMEDYSEEQTDIIFEKN